MKYYITKNNVNVYKLGIVISNLNKDDKIDVKEIKSLPDKDLAFISDDVYIISRYKSKTVISKKKGG